MNDDPASSDSETCTSETGTSETGTSDTGTSPPTETQRRIQLELALAGDPGQRAAVQRVDHGDPHLYLGPHAAEIAGEAGTIVRGHQGDATAADLLLDGSIVAMEPVSPGIFAAWLPGREPDLAYRLCFHFEGGGTWDLDDAYRFAPTLGEGDLYFFGEGTLRELWKTLGARPHAIDGVRGFAFAVWAPNARRVSIVGDWNGWDERVHPMRRIGTSGLWELFVPGVGSGQAYKYAIVDPEGRRHLKADPVGSWSEVPSKTASRTFASTYRWNDSAWMDAHEERDVRRGPLAAYEVHLGSWQAGGGDPPNYRQLAPKLVAHAKSLGFNYLELMPVAEHPYSGSWGYQVTGYFAPTARYGSPDDFRFFVDYCHQQGVGVIVDWVPAHFVKDAHGLGRFDGTALYEHEDPRRGEHPDWDTYIFNYDRFEVKNFLVSNALYWLEEFHVDGLRVDAVASMLYLDYSREEGQWIPNSQGGRENFGAIALLREVNRFVHEHYPGRFTVAEESTAFPGITRDVDRGGLGFTFKWNMGWMHDTLAYFQKDPLYRSYHHDQLTFAMIYEYSEVFVNPLSHDEVVHGKGSLYSKMPGDDWRKRANLRALLAYQFTRPGKILLFMGVEIASPREWNHETGLDWYLLDEPDRKAHRDFLAALGRVYQDHPSLWRRDHEPEGFDWIACHDRGQSIFSYARWDEGEAGDPDRDHLVIVLNLTPEPRRQYRIGAPREGAYRVLLDTDALHFGGSGYANAQGVPEEYETESAVCDGREQSLLLTLPPLSALVLAPD